MPKVVIKDHYVVLGVAYNATDKDIKEARKKLALQIHPDFLGEDASPEAIAEATALLQDVYLAAEQLLDPQCREVIDLSLGSQPTEQPTRSSEVPPAGQFLLNGIWCWVEFRAAWLFGLEAEVTVRLDDLFKTPDLGAMPHDAWIRQIIAVDESGDVVGSGYSLTSLRYEIRRLQAEARRNEARRVWRKQLAGLEAQIKKLSDAGRPTDRLWRLLAKAERLVASGGHSLRYAEHPDTVVRAIRELEKELERVSQTDAAEVLLTDLLGGKIYHRDLEYNERLIARLRIYEFRSGGAYTAPTPETVTEHYRRLLAGLTTHDDVRQTDLRLPDDEPIVLELVADGALELAPETVLIQGTKGLASYPVTYGYAKVNGEQMPVGIITVPQAAYDRNGAQYGRVSQFPTLPFDITLLIRVRVRVQDKEMLTDPLPDGKGLQNEVARCQARLRNPKELVESYDTHSFLVAWPFGA
jgi:hypothetical protein